MTKAFLIVGLIGIDLLRPGDGGPRRRRGVAGAAAEGTRWRRRSPVAEVAAVVLVAAEPARWRRLLAGRSYPVVQRATARGYTQAAT